MNDEQLIAALRTHEVGARPLDPERVIAGARRRRLRTWVASGLAVVLMAGTVTGVATLGSLGRKAAVDPVVTPSQSSSPSASSSVDTPITLGPVDPAKAEELATTCLGRSGEVVHAARVRDIDPKVEDFALVVRDTAGKLYSCFGFADELGGAALEMGPDAGTDPNGIPPGPLDRLTGGGEGSSIGVPGTTTRYIRFERWYKADASVVRVRQRYVVHGVPTGPWFTADVVDGYAFMRSWLVQPIKKGDPLGINTVQLETHAVDKSGKSTRQFGPNEDTFPAEMFPE